MTTQIHLYNFVMETNILTRKQKIYGSWVRSLWIMILSITSLVLMLADVICEYVLLWQGIHASQFKQEALWMYYMHIVNASIILILMIATFIIACIDNDKMKEIRAEYKINHAFSWCCIVFSFVYIILSIVVVSLGAARLISDDIQPYIAGFTLILPILSLIFGGLLFTNINRFIKNHNKTANS